MDCVCRVQVDSYTNFQLMIAFKTTELPIPGSGYIIYRGARMIYKPDLVQPFPIHFFG